MFFVWWHAERGSSHPIARSILEAWREQAAAGSESDEGPQNADFSGTADHISEIAGHGLQAVYRGKTLLLCNSRLMQSRNIPFQPVSGAGTVVYVAYDGTFVGSVYISDSIKEGVAKAIADLKHNGIRRIVMLTGDRKETTETIASSVGIDEVRAELLPEDKVREVEKLIDARKDGDENIGDGTHCQKDHADCKIKYRFCPACQGSDTCIKRYRPCIHVDRCIRGRRGVCPLCLKFHAGVAHKDRS